MPKYNRVIIKLSGEALAGEQKFGINQDVLNHICDEIKDVKELGVEIGIVIGGGNFWRGRTSQNMDNTKADHMGMLATTINALALQDALQARNVETRVQTAIEMRQIAEPYIRGKAIRHLEKGRVVIFACGTGNPYFTTDTGAALRAAEIEADIILLAKNVDGVYDDDPAKNINAVKFDYIDYLDVLNKGLKVMDATATSLCMDNDIPILVFAVSEHGNIRRAVIGEKIGTFVSNTINNI